MHQDPDGPYRGRSKAGQRRPKEAQDRQARPRTIHDSGFQGFLNHGSRITVVSDRQFGHPSMWRCDLLSGERVQTELSLPEMSGVTPG